MCKKEDVCWRRGQNAEHKQKTKNQSMALERQLVQIQSIRREKEGWMQLQPRLAGSGCHTKARYLAVAWPVGREPINCAFITRVRWITWSSACHFNGPLAVAAPRPPTNPPRSRCSFLIPPAGPPLTPRNQGRLVSPTVRPKHALKM